MGVLGISPASRPRQRGGVLDQRHTQAATRPKPQADIRPWAIYSHQHLALGLSKRVRLTTDEIRAMQRALAALGFYDGDIDGKSGPKTRRAHEDYRQSFLRSMSLGPVLPFAEVMVKRAEAEARAGVKEEGGENRGKRVEEYQMVVGKRFIGAPWCALFVCWCMQEAAREETKFRFALPREAGAFRFEDWAVAESEHGVTLLDPGDVKARRGDLVIFEFSHIGICNADEDEGTVSTIDGNTSPTQGSVEQERNGGGVHARRRDRKLIRSLVRLTHPIAPETDRARTAWA